MRRMGFCYASPSQIATCNWRGSHARVRQGNDTYKMSNKDEFSGNFWDGLPALEPGWVWLVGGGPGDPGLITALGLKALAAADVILHDALIDERLLTLARPEAERIYAGKRAGVKSCKQDEISETLVALAKAGKRVLRLKGGDPFVFGRGGEEAQAL